MAFIYNKKTQQPVRQYLRHNPTMAEKVLWLSLRKKQIMNVRFLRQYGIDKFILDFYAPEIKLAIEVDGISHIGKEKYDEYRQKVIEAYGIKVIRFSDEEFLVNPNKVVDFITKVVKDILNQRQS
jgi:very-short-patch-repair endonuclease